MSSKRIQYLASLGGSVILALGIGALIMLASGTSPVEGYGALISGAFGNNRAVGNMLYKAGQLAITGIATAISCHAGIFNVGGEGQMYLGALASAYVGALVTGLSPWVMLPLCFLAAVLAGAVYAWIPAILKVKLKINEVITTILMNSIAIFFCTYMANGPLKTTERGVTTGTAAISKTFQFSRLIRGSNLSESIFLIAIITLFIWYLMSRTTVGFEMKLTGQNPRFSRFVGLKSNQLAIAGMLISGAMCGLLGMFETFALQTRFKPDFSNEFYFDGMLVAMIMQYNPLGIIVMSFFFAILKIGATTMQAKTGISSELIDILQAIIIFFMAASNGIVNLVSYRRKSRRPENGIKKEVESK